MKNQNVLFDLNLYLHPHEANDIWDLVLWIDMFVEWVLN